MKQNQKKLLLGLMMMVPMFFTNSCNNNPSPEVVSPSNSEEQVDTALVQVKEEATNTINSYVNLSNYRDAQQDEISEIITSCLESINNATSIEEVNNALTSAKASIDNVKTDEELTHKENTDALTLAKEEGNALINTYVNLNDYREAQRDEINEIITSCLESINNATSIEEVNNALTSAKSSIDTIKTNEELTEEENAVALANAKEEAINTISTYVDLSKYRDVQQAEITTMITVCIDTVNNSTTIEEVNIALSTAKTDIDNVKTSGM